MSTIGPTIPRSRAAYAHDTDNTAGDSVALTANTAVISDTVSKLPRVIQFPLLLLLNFSITFVLLTFASGFTGYELSGVSRDVKSDWQVLASVAWRIGEIYVAWYLNYDDYDVAALTLQCRIPYYYFLTSFYDIHARTASILVLAEIIGAALPFTLLRRRSLPHTFSSQKPNAAILGSIELSAWTSLLAASVYGLVIFASAKSWLPLFLVKNFDGVRSLSAAYDALHLNLAFSYLPLGWAARAFLFSPSTVAAGAPGLNAIKSEVFNPATATFAEHISWNVWGWRSGVKVLLKRTAVLAAVVATSTAVKIWGTVEGADFVGAAGWGSMWGVGSIAVGLVLGWSAGL